MNRFRIKPKINPTQATDMFGNLLCAGDFVLGSVSVFGTSSRLRISRIIDVKYKRGKGAQTHNVPQHLAERWTLWVEPWLTLGSMRAQMFEAASPVGELVPIKSQYSRGVTIQSDNPVVRLTEAEVRQYLSEHAERHQP